MTSAPPVLTLGLLTPTPWASRYITDLLHWGQTQRHLQVIPLPLSAPAREEPSSKGPLQKVLKKLILKLDGKYLKTTSFREHLKTEASPSLLKGLTCDYLLSLSGTPVSEELLATTKQGALLVDAGIPLTEEPGFYGFWEVFFKKTTTPFKITWQKKDGTQEIILAGHLLTQSSYLLNQAYVSQKALHYLKTFLVNQAEGSPFSWTHLSTPAPLPTEPAPGSLGLLHYLLKRVWRTIDEKLQNRKGEDQQWNVAFLRTPWPERNLQQGRPFPMNASQFFADPFVISHQGKDVCFVEEFDFHSGLGHISAFELKESEALPLGTVFKEPFHLSFPYVFKYQDELYMCPETSGAREIRIYKCLEFPLKWKLEKTLVRDIAAVDNMIFQQGDKWWMLTNIDPLQKNDHCTELLLFSADSPLSESWKPHPQNPLVIDPRKARNAGLLRHENKLFRVSQVQKFGVYGAGSQIHEITELTETLYSEKLISTQEPHFFEGIYGTHHLHGEGALTVFDFCRKTKVDKS